MKLSNKPVNYFNINKLSKLDDNFDMNETLTFNVEVFSFYLKGGNYEEI